MSDHADRIRHLRQRREKLLAEAEDLREQIINEVRAALPKGKQAPRGRITEVADATGWTRAHVTNIRDSETKSR